MITDNVMITISSIADAPNYNEMDEKFIPVKIEKCIVVKQGMGSGLPTFDLQMTDSEGKKYLAFVTGGIMNMILAFAKDELSRNGH